MQNEILKVMALQVLQEVVASLHSTAFYTIMVYETIDISNSEQVVEFIRWVDDNFNAHEDFIGLYQVDSICPDSSPQARLRECP